MSKDHYVLLGIRKGADLKKIKKAYRKIIKEVHPDITHSEKSVKRFLEIRKAYETLADEEKRRRYDQEQENENSHISVKRDPDEFINQRPSVLNEREGLFSPGSDFLEGSRPEFFNAERAGTPRKELYFEAILTSSEARTGGSFPISVPVRERCSRCGGTGYVGSFFCSVCSGYGILDSERALSLHMPPNIKHGTEITLSMKDTGLKKIFLHIRILIDLYA